MKATVAAGNNEQIAELTAGIVSAYVSNHVVPLSELRKLIEDVYTTFSDMAVRLQPLPTEKPRPKVPIQNSIEHDGITCLEDGLKFTSLKRHLRVCHGLTPEEYREKWSLPADYPMVTSAFAETRSKLAKKSGLGTSGRRADSK